MRTFALYLCLVLAIATAADAASGPGNGPYLEPGGSGGGGPTNGVTFATASNLVQQVAPTILPLWGSNQVVYVDANNGNDANSGLSPAQPMQSINHAFQWCTFTNHGGQIWLAPYQTFLMTNTAYASNEMLIGNGSTIVYTNVTGVPEEFGVRGDFWVQDLKLFLATTNIEGTTFPFRIFSTTSGGSPQFETNHQAFIYLHNVQTINPSDGIVVSASGGLWRSASFYLLGDDCDFESPGWDAFSGNISTSISAYTNCYCLFRNCRFHAFNAGTNNIVDTENTNNQSGLCRAFFVGGGGNYRLENCTLLTENAQTNNLGVDADGSVGGTGAVINLVGCSIVSTSTNAGANVEAITNVSGNFITNWGGYVPSLSCVGPNIFWPSAMGPVTNLSVTSGAHFTNITGGRVILKGVAVCTAGANVTGVATSEYTFDPVVNGVDLQEAYTYTQNPAVTNSIQLPVWAELGPGDYFSCTSTTAGTGSSVLYQEFRFIGIP